MTPLGPEAIGWLQVRLILDKCRQFVDIKKESPWKQGLSGELTYSIFLPQILPLADCQSIKRL